MLAMAAPSPGEVVQPWVGTSRAERRHPNGEQTIRLGGVLGGVVPRRFVVILSDGFGGKDAWTRTTCVA